MLPKVAVDITARNKTQSGRKEAERDLEGFAKRASKTAREGGFEKLGKQVESLQRFRTVSFGFDATGRSLATIGHVANDVSAGVAGMTRNVLTFGGVAPKAFQAAAAGAATATGAVAGLAAALVGVGVGTYVFGDKWAKIGADVGRTAKDLGVSSRELQARRGAAARFGVSEDQVDASLEGLGSTLYDAKYGANNLALGAMNQLGVKFREREDGTLDVGAMMDDLADAIARQKNPLVQRKLAAIFGVSGMLPALREGSGALTAEGADYLASGAAFTDQEVADATAARRKSVRLRQQLGAVEKGLGTKAMGFTGAAADVGVDVLRGGGRSVERAGRVITDGAKALMSGGAEAARRLVDGAERSARRMEQGFDAFARRIEHQESRGRQLDRRGRPLTSSAGAIGARQMLPETAKRAAKLGGIPWDEHRFMYDKAYNQQLGDVWLSKLLADFDGNQVLAAAAYNAGEGRLTGYYKGKGKNRRYVRGWLERFGDPRKGQISNEDFAAKIPFDETRDYVRNTANMAVAKTEVTINLKGAPTGTTATVKGGPNVDVSVNVARSMDGH